MAQKPLLGAVQLPLQEIPRQENDIQGSLAFSSAVFVGTRFIASVAQFIERDLYQLYLQTVPDVISRDKSRPGRDKSGPYEIPSIEDRQDGIIST